ncbi:hypothetical protein HXX76_000138 [Chlamydomonas incerta]|uniref:Uncharacterized protein n=1 Tax=Chlamydomonas incerta TaxID=51695 RepID=A0A836B2J7_CHLIN|nr:hypothetical protein HXX76_000138 [Chlamydomonas incerta]|eukprot:KAG2445523.1 hypothetical protein HXX76_000138 [Chlamydomonas incerta]
MSKEASTGPSFLRFNLTQSLDVSSVVPAPVSSLIRGLYPKCICFHPTKPLLAVGVSGYVAVYDLQSNSRVGRVDLKSVPVELAFAPDGSVLIVVVQDWMVYSVSTSSWKSRLLVPRRSKMDKPLSSCMLAVAPGSNPFIYFCRYAKDTLRLATLPSRGGAPAADAAAAAAAAKEAKDGPSRAASSASGWGARVKLDVQKAILGLACHVVDAQLMVLTADGQLRGYAITGGGGDVMTPLWAVQVQDAADKVVPPLGTLTCVPHPAVAGGALILQGSRMGTATVLDAPGRGTPAQIVRGRVPNWAATIGMGFDKASNTVLAFGLSEGSGRLKCVSWRLGYRLGASGLTMRPSRVEPQDITNMLDSTRRTKAALASSMAAGAAAAAASAGPAGLGGSAASASQRNLTAGGAAGAGAAAAPPAWHGLWSVTPGWSHDVSSSCLLDGQLAPVVSRVAVHPCLGVIAAAAEPSVAVQVNRELLFGGRGALSAEEVNLARRTATVSLLTVTNLEAHACGWRGGRAASQLTGLAAWLPPGATEAATAAAAAAADDDDSSDDEAPPAPAPAAALASGAGAAPAALQLPPHVYYLAGNRLMKYSLVTRSSGTVAMLPTDAPDGDTRTPRQLVYSPKRAAWLVFFESQAAAAAAGAAAPSGGGANGAAAVAAPERFTWTYVTAASLGVGGSEGGAGPQSWVRAGKYGCFVGPADEQFAVVSANGRLLELFDSAAAPGQLAGGRPLLSCVLEGGVLLPGLGAQLFAGPPMFNAPVPEARAPPDAAPHDLRRFRGAGCVMWQSADNNLSLATLPALARVPLDAPAPVAGQATAGGGGGGGDSSDEEADPNADASGAYYPTLGHGHHFGNVGRQAALPLLSYEIVLHVAWQSLTLAAPAAAPPPPKAKKPAAAAAAAEADGVADSLRTNSTFAGAGAAIAAAAAAAGGVSAAAAAHRVAPPGLGGPTDAVAAVLTTQRLLIVTAALRVVASVSLAALGCPAAAAEPLTSVVWAGPMLLVTTAAGQVLQLTWTGQLLPVATLSPTGHVALLGVTGDSLLLLRSLLGTPPVGAAVAAAGGNAAAAAALAEAVARPASLLQPLLVGWASLAATGLLSYAGPSGSPSAAAVVRPALRHALASYDAAAVTPRGVWALIAAGAWDVAAAVAAHMPPLDSSVKLAAAAAAGEWGGVAAALAAEARRALHAPLPPPRGSELHSKLVAAAAGALFHGQLSKAGELFQAAGEWPAAMILAVCSGNLQGVHAIASKLAGEGGHGAPAAPPSPDAPQAIQLASALRSLYGGSGSGPVADLALRMEPLQLQGPQAMPAADGEPELERAENWHLASPHASPAAVAVAGALPRASAVLADGELGPIPSADPGRAPAVAYYALTATAAASVAAAAGGAAAGLRPDGGGASGRGAGGTESSSHRGPGGGGTSAGDNLETTSVASSDAAQAAARAEFLGAGGFSAIGGGPAIDFSSDDDSDSEATSAAGSSAVGGAGAAAQRRIKIQIRDAKAAAAAGGAAAAGPTGGDGGSLREAAKGLRLAPPGGGGSSRLAIGSGAVPGAAPSTGLTPAPSSGLAPALSAMPSGGGTYQFPPGMSSAQLYAGGAGLMETGDWRGAAAHFSRAMSVLNHEERAAMDEAARRARLAFCANYYAAVRLLEGVGAGAGGREARLYRYLAALRLDAKHADALLREAISRNRVVKNYRYAGDQLTALIGRVADTAPGDYLAQLQAEIEECDRHGGGNADLPSDEQTGDWAALVAAAGESGGSKEDVDALVLPLL